MSPRPNRSDQRIKEILDAATTVFSEKGFNDARVDDIVEESGLSKGTLYMYFKSKDAIIMALLDRLFEREFSELDGVIDPKPTAEGKLLAVADKMSADLKFWLKLMPVAYEFLGLIFRNKTVQKAFKTYLNGYMRMITPIIQMGLENGEFKPGDAQDIAIAIGALLEGTLLLWVYDSQLVDPEKHFKTGIRFFINGLRA